MSCTAAPIDNMARVGYCYCDIYLSAICQQVYLPANIKHVILVNPFTVTLHARDGSSEKKFCCMYRSACTYTLSQQLFQVVDRCKYGMIALGTSKPCIVSKISVPVPVCALPGSKPRRQVFSRRGSYFVSKRGSTCLL